MSSGDDESLEGKKSPHVLEILPHGPVQPCEALCAMGDILSRLEKQTGQIHIRGGRAVLAPPPARAARRPCPGQRRPAPAGLGPGAGRAALRPVRPGVQHGGAAMNVAKTLCFPVVTENNTLFLNLCFDSLGHTLQRIIHTCVKSCSSTWSLSSELCCASSSSVSGSCSKSASPRSRYGRPGWTYPRGSPKQGWSLGLVHAAMFRGGLKRVGRNGTLVYQHSKLLLPQWHSGRGKEILFCPSYKTISSFI